LASAHGQPPPLFGERAVPAPFRFRQDVLERDRFGRCPLIGWKAGYLEQVVDGAMQLFGPTSRLV
jgi:hypothetical protein